MHFIGHSRGASVVGALAEELGEAGIWVDQVTYLDTHPLRPAYGIRDWGERTRGNPKCRLAAALGGQTAQI